MITVNDYINNPTLAEPCFVQGDSLKVLSQLPDGCIDCVVTSPHWRISSVHRSSTSALQTGPIPSCSIVLKKKQKI